MRAAEVAVKSGCAFAAVQWAVCRKRYYDERETTYAAIEAQRQSASARRAAAAQAARRRGSEVEGRADT